VRIEVKPAEALLSQRRAAQPGIAADRFAREIVAFLT